MGERAAIESLEALTGFRADLCKSAESIAVALAESEAEIQRTLSWLQQDQRNYWKRQLSKRAELHARAKSVLKRKQLMKTPMGGRYSTIEDEKAVALAERRLEEAKQKQENVKRWTRLLDEESFSYKAVAQGLGQIVDVDVPNALASVANMIVALEAYAAPAAPTQQRSVAPLDGATMGVVEASMAREAPAQSPLAETYADLRRRTPIADVCAAVAPAETPPQLPELANVSEVLGALEVERVPLAPDDRVIITRGIEKRRRIYLERIDAGENKWFIGAADNDAVDGYDAVRVSGLLAARPELAELLGAPVGTLVVLDGDAVETILSSSDAVLWPSAA